MLITSHRGKNCRLPLNPYNLRSCFAKTLPRYGGAMCIFPVMEKHASVWLLVGVCNMNRPARLLHGFSQYLEPHPTSP